MDDQYKKTEHPYSRKQWARAVNLSAFLGWLMVAVPICAGTSNAVVANFIGLMIWAAALGLPIAFLASWLIVAPLLKRLMRKNFTWIRTVYCGCGIAFLVALTGITIERFRGWMRSIDPTTYSQLGGGDKTREIDGILTSYGWLVLAQNTVIFVAGGIAISLVVRLAIGPGRRAS